MLPEPGVSYLSLGLLQGVPKKLPFRILVFFLAVPADKNTGRSGCLPACDLAAGESMCFWHPLPRVFLTGQHCKKKHKNSKG